MAEIIDKYMLCTFEPSTLSEDGTNLDYFDPPISENVIKVSENMFFFAIVTYGY